jgi:hypothetical protein
MKPTSPHPCVRCGGAIKKPSAKLCIHCTATLKSKRNLIRCGHPLAQVASIVPGWPE